MPIPEPGGGGPPTEPIDSILKKISELANLYSDSIYNLSLNQRAEYSFTIVAGHNNILDTFHVHTNGSGMAVVPTLRVPMGKRLRGIWHSHIVDEPIPLTDTTARSGPSGDDVGNLFDLLNLDPSVPILTDCGNIRYALVVENSKKANTFFRTPGNGPLLLYNKLLQLVHADPRVYTSEFQNLTIEKLLLILGSSASHGIALYKSNNVTKTTYTKLN